MLHKYKNRKQEGFTIIEVLIVLAIAGLIILIVLLAVPALQRSSRNTGMKNDASAVAAAVSEFKSNNDGRAPNVLGITGTAPDISVSNSTYTGAAPASAKVQSGTVVTGVAAGPVAYTQATESTIYIVVGFKCNSASGGNYAAATDLQANTRGTAILYPIEQRTGAPLGRCIDA